MRPRVPSLVVGLSESDSECLDPFFCPPYYRPYLHRLYRYRAQLYSIQSQLRRSFILHLQNSIMDKQTMLLYIACTVL